MIFVAIGVIGGAALGLVIKEIKRDVNLWRKKRLGSPSQ